MKNDVPLNALRAFYASARYLNFTHAGMALFVSQAAVSQQVRLLEERLGVTLFRRLPRGLEMTDESRLLFAEVSEAFTQLEKAWRRFEGGEYREVMTLACVGTFALGWLLPRLDAFHQQHPALEVNVRTHNNVVNLAGEGIDYAIRFGTGAWPATHNEPLFTAPLTALCRPDIARRLQQPGDLLRETLLRSYRADEWGNWFTAANITPPRMTGPVFDSSRLMVEAAVQTGGVALVPFCMFQRELEAGILVRPFDIEIDVGGYWLTWLRSKTLTPSMEIFREWIRQQVNG
ncbi:LysR family transcriptional regulator [Pantoea sp. PNA 14-12]|uniref:LysR family transcriptional regulator n=1 Tax=Pantoea TaxID=53335 RepID=UPI000510142C|nr:MULTISPECIES: LysR family transcriptional regulator [Pantoea]KKW52401.1 LysR family transcriptional regulator [Pantoea ananatis]KGD82541.1 LysR family transcriptional regulator [Pantoea stewartii subsp. indologenes]KHE02184.1 LysR family transcriptional regulator [Pantoea stewartii]KHN61833.1 LysR family transcriptional regulator [Pantoea stewartii]TDS72203.1 LysR family transcriptional regulator [Pantoea sp. PNA 14-12]